MVQLCPRDCATSFCAAVQQVLAAFAVAVARMLRCSKPANDVLSNNTPPCSPPASAGPAYSQTRSCAQQQHGRCHCCRHCHCCCASPAPPVPAPAARCPAAAAHAPQCPWRTCKFAKCRLSQCDYASVNLKTTAPAVALCMQVRRAGDRLRECPWRTCRVQITAVLRVSQPRDIKPADASSI